MAICLDSDWQTNEFMLYCRSAQLRENDAFLRTNPAFI